MDYAVPCFPRNSRQSRYLYPETDEGQAEPLSREGNPRAIVVEKREVQSESGTGFSWGATLCYTPPYVRLFPAIFSQSSKR